MGRITEYKDISSYAENYSKSGFWNKIKSSALKLGESATHYALILFYTLESRDVPIKNKAIIIAALGYLISPVDMIPDVIPILGLTDDAAAIKLAYDTVKASITPDIERKASDKLSQWFGKNA